MALGRGEASMPGRQPASMPSIHVIHVRCLYDCPLLPTHTRCLTPLRPIAPQRPVWLSCQQSSGICSSHRRPLIGCHARWPCSPAVLEPLWHQHWTQHWTQHPLQPTKGRPLLAAGDQSLIIIIPDTTRPLTLSHTLALAPSRWWRNSVRDRHY